MDVPQRTDLAREAGVIGRLRCEFEERGYTFESPPDRDTIPAFLGQYVPDAIAIKGDEHIAIELKLGQSRDQGPTLADIRRKFDNQEGWTFDVVYATATPEAELVPARAHVADVQRHRSEIDRLLEEGHDRAALVMAWSLLEAAFNAKQVDKPPRAMRSASQLVQALAMLGIVDGTGEKKLTRTARVRNLAAHGDLSSPVEEEDVWFVLSVMESALSFDPAL